MAASDESFLPQIVGLFYATFDPKLGPTVLHQVPENLLTFSSNDEDRSRSASRSRDRASSYAVNGLIDFAPISEYVIPKKSLHGKLVTLTTTGGGLEYKIMGFPSVIEGEAERRYQRNEYMWNLCFVFHASSALDAFEPVVRKCGRILRSAEIDSGYLSSPDSAHTPVPAVLEQLFEDLNSYSETSIPLDGFNSLELKLFPFYPNPPDCEEWHVPVALANLAALKDDNWDITAARVSQFINGVNHVRRIADLADADLDLTKETLRHMLYYQVVMMIDIFQYSNMYTLKPSITRLAADESVISECAAYVCSKPVCWPTLLHLYSKLLPGVTIHEWLESNEVLALGIDPRRFVSFGIIKGFLRRVHRWPVLLERGTPLLDQPRRRVGFEKGAHDRGALSIRNDSGFTHSTRNESNLAPSTSTKNDSRTGPESTFSRLGGDSNFTLRSTESNASLGISPGSSLPRPPSFASPSRRTNQLAFTSTTTTAGPPVPRSSAPSSSSRKTLNTFSKSGGALHRATRDSNRTREIEEDLMGYLDGMHHSDEIQVRFGMGWSGLERLLGVEELIEGKGKKGVALIYR